MTVVCFALSLAAWILVALQSGSFTQTLLIRAHELVGVGDPGSSPESSAWWPLVLFVVGVVGVAVGLLILTAGVLKGMAASARAARESPQLARGAAATARAGRVGLGYGRTAVERIGRARGAAPLALEPGPEAIAQPGEPPTTVPTARLPSSGT